MDTRTNSQPVTRHHPPLIVPENTVNISSAFAKFTVITNSSFVRGLIILLLCKCLCLIPPHHKPQQRKSSMAVCPESKQRYRGHSGKEKKKQKKQRLIFCNRETSGVAFEFRAQLCSEQMCKHLFLHTLKAGVKELLTCLAKMYKKTLPTSRDEVK